MNLISYEGPGSKHTKGSTIDSVILGLNTYFVDGIRLDVYITSDNILIAMDNNSLNKIGLNKRNVMEKNYNLLSKHNIGSNVKKLKITSIKDVLKEIDKHDKNIKILLNLTDNNLKNSTIVDTLKDLELTYPMVDIYIQAENDELLEYLITSNFNYKIGQLVTKNKKVNPKFDFYSFAINDYDKNEIRNLHNNNKEIIINTVNNKKDLDNLYRDFPNIIDDIYIETSNIGLINRYKR